MGWARDGGLSGLEARRERGAAACSRASTPSPLPDCVNCDDLAGSKSTTLTLHWLTTPRTALVVCKLSAALVPSLNATLRWLRDNGVTTFVEPAAYPNVEPDLTQSTCSRPLQQNGEPAGPGAVAAAATESIVSAWEAAISENGGERCGRIVTWPEARCPATTIPDEVAHKLDFVVVLGGDGTLLWTCHMFGNRAVPPILPFNMGSLGFLTPFPPEQLSPMLHTVLKGGFPMILRHRLHCTVLRAADGEVCSEGQCHQWKDGHSTQGKVVMNEVVIDRGISPFLTNLEAYCDGIFVTHVQGDGLILSSPTGSTAYNLAAGGSMIHPQVPGILFTPICPHSLSFRPLIFPDHVELRIQVPHDSRAKTYCSFDGKDRLELNAGDAVVICMSQWPVPTLCSQDPSRDWFMGIRHGLHWNERRQQGGVEKPL